MPNGGSDCCGTCWFNSKNNGEVGHGGAKKEGIVKCIIRNLEIPNPFWTYCVNHPYHNPQKIDLPLGPVYICDSYPYYRKIWKLPPDTEEIRKKLLEILDNTDASEKEEYSEMNLEEEAIHQLRILKDKRALPKLLKITKLDISNYKKEKHPMIHNKAITVGLAIEALLDISGGNYLNHVMHFIDLGVDRGAVDYNKEEDGFRYVRYHLIRGLEYCNAPKADDLLRQGLNDPDQVIGAFAQEILKKRTRH